MHSLAFTRHIISNAFLSESNAEAATLIAYMTAYGFDDGTLKIRCVRSRGQWRMADQSGTPEFECPRQ